MSLSSFWKRKSNAVFHEQEPEVEPEVTHVTLYTATGGELDAFAKDMGGGTRRMGQGDLSYRKQMLDRTRKQLNGWVRGVGRDVPFTRMREALWQRLGLKQRKSETVDAFVQRAITHIETFGYAKEDVSK